MKEIIKISYEHEGSGIKIESTFTKDENKPYDEMFWFWVNETLKSFGLPEGEK